VEWGKLSIMQSAKKQVGPSFVKDRMIYFLMGYNGTAQLVLKKLYVRMRKVYQMYGF